MATAESYLKPEVAQQIARLDLRAKFIVEGFLSGLHASPFQGFSVEFSEHRRYEPGEDIKDIDWLAYAKTDRYYVKKYQAETNLNGYLLVDLSESMGYTHRQALTKFDYCVCLAAAMAYLMHRQQDPVGLVTFDTQLRASLKSRSSRAQLGNILSLLSKATPTGPTDVSSSLMAFAGMIKQKSLAMVFSDLLPGEGPDGEERDTPEQIAKALNLLRHRGHDVILFHVLDEAEVNFPFEGMADLRDPEDDSHLIIDASGVRKDYLAAVAEFRESIADACQKAGADYVPLDTSMQFDKALIEYLQGRQARF